MKTIRKAIIIPAIPFLAGVVCWIAYMVKGSYVAEDGMLVEPFYLIGLGWFFLFIALFSAVIIGVAVMLRKKKSAVK